MEMATSSRTYPSQGGILPVVGIPPFERGVKIISVLQGKLSQMTPELDIPLKCLVSSKNSFKYHWSNSPPFRTGELQVKKKPESAYHQVLGEDGFVVLVNFIEFLDLIFCTGLQKLLNFLEGCLSTVLGLALVHRLRGQQVNPLIAPFHGLDT